MVLYTNMKIYKTDFFTRYTMIELLVFMINMYIMYSVDMAEFKRKVYFLNRKFMCAICLL